MPLIRLSAFALLAALTVPALSAAEPFGTVTVEQVAADLGKPGVHLFDVNPKGVYDAGHVPGAKLVPHKPDASDLPSDRSAKLVFYCKNPH